MATVSEILKPIFDEKGIPVWVWKPIMLMESGGNPNAHADTQLEDSRGLFQINIKGNPRFAGEDLFNPSVNGEIARDFFILPAWNKIKNNSFMNEADKTSYVWRTGIRPAWNDTKDRAIRTKTAEVLSGGLTNKEEQIDPSKTPSTGGSSGGSSDDVLLTIPIPYADDWKITKSGLFSVLLFGFGGILLVLALYSMFLSNSPMGMMKGGN